MTDHAKQIEQLKSSMKALEAQRSVLGEESVDAALVGVRLKLAELEAEPPTVSQTEGERRHATIVFSDLSGYTAMSEKLDPEEVEEIMNRVKEAAIRIIESYDGTVNQFIGDEVVALFGIPKAVPPHNTIIP
jgi:class 3 adenylate cyclase